MKIRLFGLACGLFLWLLANCPSTYAQRQMENLGRGVVAVNQGAGQVYVGWRMLGTDPSNIGFNLYRSTGGGTAVKLNSVPITNTTDYVNTGVDTSQSTAYFVRPVVGGVEQVPSVSFTLPANAPANPYLSVPLQVPPGGTTPDGTNYTYSANDCSVGDVDGDGEYEIIVKWDPSNSKDNAQSGYTGNVFLDAYKLNGTRLWRIDLGKNIRAGAHYTQFMVYDLDGDGKAEVACKTAPGTVDGLGNNVIMPGDNPNTDYRNSSGYILSGPEYLTIFNGQTGAALATTNYIPPRGTVSSWGDSYGNRVDRFLACVAYLDGQRPSLVMCRGYYTRTVLAAWNWRSGQLTNLWTFDSNNPGNSGYAGQGNHNLCVADVNGDGKDEIIYGACTINHDGTGLYTTGLGHGDAVHCGKMNPDRSGLLVWDIHETPSTYSAGELHDAATGQILWGLASTGDSARGTAGHIDAYHRGFQMWGAATGGVYDENGNLISTNTPSYNFMTWWGSGLERYLLDGTKLDAWNGSGTDRIMTFYHYGTASSNNGTKNNPCLSADILGDWREEVILRSSDSTQLLIFTTTTPAVNRFYTFMHDPQYRLGVAWQNVAYNQYPDTSFYIGEGMSPPPTPDIYLVGSGDVAPSAPSGLAATAASSSQINLVWTDNSTNETFFLIERSPDNATFTQIGSVSPNVTNYTDTGLSGSTTYYYRVRAGNGGGNSDYSGTTSATTLAAPPGLTWRGDGLTNAWDKGNSSNWFNGAGLIPYSDGTIVTFDDTGTNSPPLNLVGTLLPGSVTVNAAQDYKFDGSGMLGGAMALVKSGAGLLTLDGSNSFYGGVTLNSGTLTISNALAAGTGIITLAGGVMNNNATIANAINVIAPTTLNTGNSEMDGAISGNSTLFVYISGGNTYTTKGSMTGFGGTFALGASTGYFRMYGSLGSATATFDLGTGTATLNNRNGGVTVQLGELTGGPGTTLTGRSTGGAGSVTTFVVGGNGASTTFNGRIIDGNSPTRIVKVGNGAWTLTSVNNTYSGGTTVSNGTLLVNGPGGNGAGTGAVVVASSATLGGNGTIGGPVTVNSGGTFTPGGDDVGTLTISNNLILNGVVALQYDLGTNSDQTIVSSNLTLSGTLNVSDAGGFGGGTYTLFTYGGSLTYNGVTIGTVPNTNHVYTILTNVPGQVQLQVIAAPVAVFTADPTRGLAPLTVTFTDASTGTITNRHWDFGDGNTLDTTATSAVHTYATGAYTVTLTESGPRGVSSITESNLIAAVTPFQAWQFRYFGSTDATGAAGDADPDGDGMSNLAEFLAGTDPTNSLSGLKIISLTQQGNDLVITWTTAGGRTNQVQATAGDANGGFTTNFVDVSGPIIIPSAGDMTTNYVETGGATNAPARYYRVRLVP